MKETKVLCAVLLAIVILAPAVSHGALIDLGPKASLYINDDVRFGLGVEAVINPMHRIGFRIDLTEIVFDPTTFYLNQGSSIDAFLYFPARRMRFYVYSGLGLWFHDTPEDTQTQFVIRGGIGAEWSMRRRCSLFVEPGISIADNGGTDVIFRLSAGARFGVIR